MRILFFGTPDISGYYFSKLTETENVVAVVTQPDRPSGRGRHLRASSVKEAALKEGIRVFQPVKFDKNTIDAIKELKPDIGVVVSYGRLIPEDVYSIPFYGCFNIHFSLLPKYRGAGPIQWALIKGECETGVTAFWIEKTLDSGPILIQKKIDILPEDDSVSLKEKLLPLGCLAMKETIENVKNGRCMGKVQSGEITHAPVLKKSDGRINWNKNSSSIVNLIRATKPWPGAFTKFESGKQKGKTLKILKAEAIDKSVVQYINPGEISCCIDRKGFAVGCRDSALLVREVHLENRKPVNAWDFAQGAHMNPGDRFE